MTAFQQIENAGRWIISNVALDAVGGRSSLATRGNEGESRDAEVVF